MADIVLTTLNARYIHASLGLRYLLANLGELEARARLLEFTLDERPADVVEQVLRERPRIVGLGVYIWNAEQSAQVASQLKTVAPEVIVVLGGPEVSYEYESQAITQAADYVICGAADLAFAELCRQVLEGQRPTDKFIQAGPIALDRIAFPYRCYSDQDIAHRLIYVEASRGCPFKCEFCLSALDKTAWPFDLEAFLAELDQLHRRGVRHFKFVDRTFNLNVKTSRRILEFFLERLDADLFLHFEVIPDHLPDGLKEMLQRFPEGSLQLEVGVQSFNPEVQALISRKQDNTKTAENLRWLREHSHAHLHADLIIGLPGEDLESFAAGFNRLWWLQPHEIQVGILKRLNGAPIARHTQAFAMRYSPTAPYELLSNRDLDFFTMQRLKRFARYWDLVANSGRFPHTLPRLLGERPFERFLQFSDWLYAATGQTHRIALPRLFQLLHQALTTLFGEHDSSMLPLLARDCATMGAKGCPDFLHPYLQQVQQQERRNAASAPARQARHMKN